MRTDKKQYHISLSLTGASGVIYGIRLLQFLARNGHQVDLIMSAAAIKCAQIECNFSASNPKEILKELDLSDERVQIHAVQKIESSLASGSALRNLDAGVIMPCSMGSVARVAMGNSGNLIERHADVLMKEKIPLIIVPRETPLSTLHLENLHKLSQLGCHIVPAMPGFYHQPKRVDDLIHHVVGKVLDVIGIDHQLFERWQGA